MLYWSWRSFPIHAARAGAGAFEARLPGGALPPSISIITSFDGEALAPFAIETLEREAGSRVRASSGPALPVPHPAHEQERSGLVRTGQIVAGGVRKTLDQRFLVALVARLQGDRGDDDEDPLL